jgi:hypothetical protein
MMVNKQHGPPGSTGAVSMDPMVDFVVEQFKMYENHWKDRFDEARKIYDHWNNKAPARKESWMNAVHVPLTLEAEQTISPRLSSALFPNSAPVEVLVEGKDQNREMDGIIIKDAIKHYFRLANVEGKGSLMMSQCTLLGTGYGEESWLVEKKWIFSDDPESEDRYQVLTANRPDFHAVDFFEMYPHPAKMEIKDGLPLIRRRFADAEYIKELSENPNFSNLKKALDSEQVITSETTQWKDNKTVGLPKRDEYEILEYWGPWHSTYLKDKEVTTQIADQYWIVVVNRSVKITGKANPHNFGHPPYVKIKLMEDPKPSWFGVGVGKAGLPTQERLNKLVNQRLDNVDLVLNKQGCYNGNDPLINTRKLWVSKPGLWHKCSDTVTSLKWMETPDVTSSSYKEEELAKQDFRESTGAVNPLMPADSGQHRTAMGLNLLQGAAGMRFRPVLRKMEIDFIQLLAEMFLSDLQQFMTIPEWIETMTREGKPEPVELTPEMIQRRVKFMPSGVSETLNKELQVGQLLRFKELTQDDPTVNRREINKRIAELMGFKDIQLLLTPPAPYVTTGGPLSPEDQLKIQQRVAEGGDPEQILAEMFDNNQPGTAPNQNSSEPSVPAPAGT